MDKYKETTQVAAAFVLHKLDVEVVRDEEGTKLISNEGTHEDHASRLIALLAIQSELYKHALTLSLGLRPENEGVITLNRVREQAASIMDKLTDVAIESYLDNNISTEEVEVKS